MRMSNKNKLNITAYGGGLAFFSAISIFVIITFLGQTIFGLIFEQTSVEYIAICSTFSAIAFAIVSIYYGVKVKKPFENLFSINKFNPIHIVLTLILSAGMFFGLGFINTAFVELLKSVGITLSSSVVPLNNFGNFILFSILLAFIPAVFEEIFFRGVLLNSLNKVKTLIAAILVGGCFALYHCSLAQLIYQFIYGVLLCLLVKTAKSVIPAVISHFINNFAVILLEYYRVQIDLFNPIIIACGIALLVVFTILTLLILKKSSKPDYKKGEVKDFFLPCGVFGMVICLVLTLSVIFVGA
ncbi:MAG: CPBP family intramembrane metalloprotease [Clostridiales bacterium]|nr:CPBP family intramembrane metalloprotease [Clostridiales bacterium]